MVLKVSKDILYKKTLSEQVFEILYSSIINGEIKQGEELVEHELARTLKVSRTPIREAVNRLKAMDLVEGNNYSVVKVKSWAGEEIDEIFELKTLLAGYLTETALDKCTAVDINHLEELLRQSYVDINPRNPENIIEQDRRFYQYIYKISGKKKAVEMVNKFCDMLGHYGRYNIKNTETAMKVYESLLKLVVAMKRGDKKLVAEETARHMEVLRKLYERLE